MHFYRAHQKTWVILYNNKTRKQYENRRSVLVCKRAQLYGNDGNRSKCKIIALSPVNVYGENSRAVNNNFNNAVCVYGALFFLYKFKGLKIRAKSFLSFFFIGKFIQQIFMSAHTRSIFFFIGILKYIYTL